MKKILKFYILALLVITSCSKDDDTVKYSKVTDIVIPISSKDAPVKSGSSITIKGNGFSNSCEIWLLPSNIKVKIATISNSRAVITIPYVNGEQSIILHQHDEEQILGKIYIVKKDSELYSSWGLLPPIGEIKNNNCNYEWYIDQYRTGKFRFDNCGPASTTMMLKWNDVDFNKTTEDARAIYRPDGAWWWTYDVTNYLKRNGTTPNTYKFNSVADLKSVIDANGLAVLCLDMHYITETDNLAHRIHKFYKSEKNSGHFIVVKGYIYSDGKLFFEVYDSANGGRKYPDGEFKGKDRYYLGSDIYKSADMRWKSIIAIFPTGITRSADISSLEISNIPPSWGR